MGHTTRINIPPVTSNDRPYETVQSPPLTGEELITSQPDLPAIPYIRVSVIVSDGIRSGLEAVAYIGDPANVFNALGTMDEMDNFRHLAQYLAVVAIRGGATEEAAAEAGGGVYRLLANSLNMSHP